MHAPDDVTWRPDDRYDHPAALGATLEGRVLPLVSRPARYLGGEAGVDGGEHWRPDGVNALLCFPDAYEVGMSHTGLRVLYSLLAEHPDTFCDLAFTPWPDMEAAMRTERLPLFGLASRRPARQFDLIGVSIGYELAYTNLLTMLDLAGVALRADARGEGDPIVVAGGTCAMNPLVFGPFCDVVLPGDGEESLVEVTAAIAAGRAAGHDRAAILAAVRAVPGAWWSGCEQPVQARVLRDLNQVPMPRAIVPITEPVHDRLAIEVMRGCARGCRFCQAGMIQRPVRERDVSAIVTAARQDSQTAGYAEVGLLSLSTGDYTGLGDVVAGIQDELQDTRTNLVLPSLRMDSLDGDLLERVGRERPSSVTFAPEAGTQRLRDVINKQITAEEILGAAREAFARGVGRAKLYFMIGLPTETDADLDGLVDLVAAMVHVAPRGGGQITVSISPFAPKAHTPFQWAGQIPGGEIARRNEYLATRLRRLKVKVSLRDPDVSVLEGVLGLGDARLADVVEAAWRDGARFDAWDECFDISRWHRALATVGVDASAITAPRDPAAALPWQGIRGPVSVDFLRQEWSRALAGETTEDCRIDGPCRACAACGDGLVHLAAAPAAAGDRRDTVAAVEDAPAPEAPTEDARWRFWRERASAKIWCRLEFAKRGRMVYLGHLDFQRQLHLALRRSGLPVAYSKGYHPHPLVKYGPPLPVGVAGEREVFDLALAWRPADWFERLEDALPPGLELGRGVVVGSITPPSIDGRAERFGYRVSLPATGAGALTTAAAEDVVARFLASERWPHTRSRPGKKDIEIDARTLVAEDGLRVLEPTDAQAPARLSLSLQRPEGAGLSVHEFLAALFGAALPEPRWCAVVRTEILGRDDAGRWRTPFDEVADVRRDAWWQARLND